MKRLIFLSFLLLTSTGFAATEKAILAGGCFWCLEPPFESVDGVISVVSGYTGGKVKDPSYQQVSSGDTGHIEAVEVSYDTTKLSYKDILAIFWKNIDPLDPKGQFCDKGEQYTSGIFYLNESQKQIATESLNQLKASKRFKGKTLVSFIRSGERFYPAEDYHQDYYKKNPLRYKYYRFSCGRDQKLEEIWGK